jgi:hypothetical protein
VEGPGLEEVVGAWVERTSRTRFFRVPVEVDLTKEGMSDDDITVMEVVSKNINKEQGLQKTNVSKGKVGKASSEHTDPDPETKEVTSDDDEVMVMEVVEDIGEGHGRKEDVVNRDDQVKTASYKDPTQKHNIKAANKRNRPELLKPLELETVQAAMAESGDALNIPELARMMGRHQSTIRAKVKQIQRQGGIVTEERHTRVTLEEDLVIIDWVVARLQGRKLKDQSILSPNDENELARELKRSPSTPISRWGENLQLWLLQNAAGTLNLRVEHMLFSHVAECYSQRSDINWDDVTAKPEFAGHTKTSLKRVLYKVEILACSNYGIILNDISLQQVLNFVENKYRARPASEKKRERQRRVIEYFEERVAALGVTDYL